MNLIEKLAFKNFIDSVGDDIDKELARLFWNNNENPKKPKLIKNAKNLLPIFAEWIKGMEKTKYYPVPGDHCHEVWEDSQVSIISHILSELEKMK
jgi:hypothetical protein